MIRHLAAGLRILGERWSTGLRRWAGAGENWADTGVRWALLLGALYVAAHLLLGSWIGISVVVLVVGMKALRAATKATGAPQPKAAGPAPEQAADSPGGRPQDIPPHEFVALAYRTIGTARAAYLKTLAAALAAECGGDWEIADVRRLCEAAGVTVTPTVRAPGGKPTVGVYRVHLPPLPEPLPEGAVSGDVAVVVAGQDGTTPPTTAASTTPTTRTIGGVRVTSIPDADNPHRTHVTVQARPARR